MNDTAITFTFAYLTINESSLLFLAIILVQAINLWIAFCFDEDKFYLDAIMHKIIVILMTQIASLHVFAIYFIIPNWFTYALVGLPVIIFVNFCALAKTCRDYGCFRFKLIDLITLLMNLGIIISACVLIKFLRYALLISCLSWFLFGLFFYGKTVIRNCLSMLINNIDENYNAI